MMLLRKIVNAVCFAGLVFLLFLVFFQDRLVLPTSIQVIGRMHPLLLHFPIVLLVIVAIGFVLKPQEELKVFWDWLRLIAALTAIVTAIMGMFLLVEQTDKGDTLLWHKWWGVSTAFIAYLVFLFPDKLYSNNKYAYGSATIILISLLMAGHFGATLTHGEDFLWQPFNSKLPKLLVLEEVNIFPDIIKPILDDKCSNCHKASSMKGGLSLQDSLTIMKGGKNGKAILAGNSQKSLLFTRLLLPMHDKKHMPLAEKPQLNGDEIKLIDAWIMAGAPYQQLLINRNANDSFSKLAYEYISPRLAKKTDRIFDFDAADPKLVASLNNNYRMIKPMGATSPALAVSFFGRASYSYKNLQELDPIKKQIVHLNLAKMPVTNNQLAWIGKLPNLLHLNLNYTEIDNSQLDELTNLNQLESISIVGTKLDKNGVKQLLQIKSLQELFVWNTLLSAADVESLQASAPKLHIQNGSKGIDTMIVALNKPLIKTAGGFFKNKLSIELQHVIKGVQIYYTVNGQEPDSASKLYHAPFEIDSSCKVTVKAYKKGWKTSAISSAQYLKAGIPISKVMLLTKPDEKYALQADKILFDLDAGDASDFGTRWLGYQKNEAIVMIDMGTKQVVKELKILNLQNIGAHIFPPVNITVWGSNDQASWKPLTNLHSVMPTKNGPVNIPLLKLSFEPTALRYLKFKADPIKKLPEWHPGKGKPGWFFVSELVVD